MKKILIAAAFISLLGADLIETKQGLFLELYADSDFQSKKIAQVSVDGGEIEIGRCVTKGNESWCNVRYISKTLSIDGFSDKKTLVKLQTKPKTKDNFEATFGGRYTDVAMDVIVEKDGGFSVYGYTESFGHGQKDIYVVRTDKYGNKLSYHAYGGSETDKAYAALRLNDGSTIVVGDTTSFGNRAQSMYVARIAKNGKMMWERGIYNDKDDYYGARSVAKSGGGNFIVAGYEDHVKFFGSELNGFVTALHPNGKIYALRYYGGEDDEKLNSIISTKDGYVLAGYSDTWGHGRKDAYVLKVDKSGNRIFARVFGYNYDEVANQIIESNDGGYILVGTTDSDTDRRRDIFVVKLDAKGKRIWQYRYGTREEDEGLSITRAHDGGYVLAGYTKDTKNYDRDLYLIKIAENGDALWEKRYGGSRDDVANKIKKTADGYIVVGYRYSTQTFSKDVYMVKVDKNGNLR